MTGAQSSGDVGMVRHYRSGGIMAKIMAVDDQKVMRELVSGVLQ